MSALPFSSRLPVRARRAAAVAAVAFAAAEMLEGRCLMSGDAATVQPLPYTLDFSAAAGGMLDAGGQGTGFTWVQTNKNGNEYQPGLINLDTGTSRLKLTTTGTSLAGGPWETDNTLVDALQTQFNGTSGTGVFTVSTRLVGPLTNLKVASEQGGIMFGPDDDNYIKLSAGSFANGQFIQFVDEEKSGSSFTHQIAQASSFTSIGSFANIQTLDLMLAGDPATGIVTGYYRVNGGPVHQLSQQITLSGTQRTTFFSSTARAGVFAMAKNDQPPVTATFDSFAITAGTPASQLPSVTHVAPASGSSGVSRNVFVACDLHLPNGGIDQTTMTSANVYLFRSSDHKLIPASVNTTGGGDAIVLTPTNLLDQNTKYTFVCTSGVKDVSGATLVPFSVGFTTGTDGGSVDSTIAFNKVALPTATGAAFTCARIGPDHRLYASTDDGRLFRFDISSDGTLGTPVISKAIQTLNGGQRLISGFTFDPHSTASNVILWVSNSDGSQLGALDWTGKVSVVSGASMGTALDAVINLPRSFRDHSTAQPAFGPDGALYFCQASNTAMGDADNTWGNYPEHLLNAAILRLDTTKITPGQPLDAMTDSGGTYNPFAAGAPLTIYATGVRNAFDIVFADDGTLYAASNGSAAGGNAPAYSSSDPNQANGPRIDTHKPYNGPNVPALTNIPVAEDDYIFKITQGGYYGHPNITRGEYVLNGGNPTSGTDPNEVSSYPVGTLPDKNYRAGDAYDIGAHISPDGILEYQNGVFDGALQGKLLVVEYSGGGDIAVLTRDSTGKIVSAQRNILGLSGFNNPLNVCEDPATGNLYVVEYGGKKITLLRPSDTLPPGPPTVSSVTATSGGAINVAWSASTAKDAAGYNLYRATSDGGPWVKLNAAPLQKVTYADNSAAVAQTSYYKVTAVDTSGNESDFSNVGSAFRANPNPPAVPTGVVATAALSGITVDWQANTEFDLSGYNLFRAASAGGPWTLVNTDAPITSATYLDSGAPASATSYYRVSAANTSGKESAKSGVSDGAFRPDATPPAAPQSVVATYLKQSITITWAADTDSDLIGYNVYRCVKVKVTKKSKKAPPPPFVKVNDAPLTTPSFTDVSKNPKKVMYRITAIDSSGNESDVSLTMTPKHYKKLKPAKVKKS